ncbi:hypothetical protein NHX12_006841, partial [Muraenolepis orangiensis]
MEAAVRTLLQNPDSQEGPKVDPLDLMKAYKDKLLEEMWKQQDSLEAPPAPARPEETEHPTDSRPLLERLRALEEENSALSLENDNQRRQYEHCLDEVANQVVQALLTQKDLKEECVKLRTRVFDLEQQNRILNVLFQQRVKMSANTTSQEVQKNGRSGIPAGRWPSLLSLTCPRSSCSGSELSLSSTCSEYSSGSHTWAEGRGSSKQSATSREKRMSAGSVSSHNSADTEPAELGWKEGQILKGLKRLQMRSPNRLSPPASVPHYKDCMTSNEGIYSLGAKDQASQVGGDGKDLAMLESLRKKLKPQACDSARKAFILRSKSADGGSVGRRESHDAVRACIPTPCLGSVPGDMQGHGDLGHGDNKLLSSSLCAVLFLFSSSSPAPCVLFSSSPPAPLLPPLLSSFLCAVLILSSSSQLLFSPLCADLILSSSSQLLSSFLCAVLILSSSSSSPPC